MLAAPIPENDDERVASLERMKLLSTPAEADLDRIVRVAQNYFHTEMALISLIDKDRQWFKARCGLDAPETPREVSFCGHAIHNDGPLIVSNALDDERFADNPNVVDGPRVRFYAGQPLTNAEGYKIGTLCVISAHPRVLSDADIETLQDMGRLVEMALENRSLSESQHEMMAALEAAERDRLLDPLTGVWNRRGIDDLLTREMERAVRDERLLAVAKVDIDGFSAFKAMHGDAAADEAVKLVARGIVENVRSIDAVGRDDDDSFVILFPEMHAVSLPQVGDKMLRTLRRKPPIRIGNDSHKVKVSIGLTASAPKRGSTVPATEILALAVQALNEAKGAGGDQYQVVGVPGYYYTEVALA